MLSIHLHKLQFYSFHGVHEEERMLGGEYEMDLEVRFEESVNVITDLETSVNYNDLYDIADTEMSVPTSLLETVVMKIGERIHLKYAELKEISVSLTKLNPPIAKMKGSVGVRWKKKY